MWPFTGVDRSGEIASAVPTIDASGQCPGASCDSPVSLLISSDSGPLMLIPSGPVALHALIPSTTPGETDMPSGSVIVASRTAGVVFVSGDSFSGTFKLTPSPTGSSAVRVSGSTPIPVPALNANRSQPVTAGKTAVLSVYTSGSCEESACRPTL